MKKLNINIEDKAWEKMYLVCKKHYDRNGNLDIQDNKTQIWLKKQRYLYKNNSLNSQKVSLLNELNIDWFPEINHYKELINILSKESKSIEDLKESLYYHQLKAVISNDKHGYYLEIANELKALKEGVISGN